MKSSCICCFESARNIEDVVDQRTDDTDFARPSEQTWETVVAKVEAVGEHADLEDDALLVFEKGLHLVVAFVGEPYCYEAEFDSRSGWGPVVDPTRHDLVLRIRINVYVEHLRRMRVFDMDTRTFKQLAHLRDKYGLEHWLYEIVQETDHARNPEFSIWPEERLCADLRELIAATPQHFLHL